MSFSPVICLGLPNYDVVLATQEVMYCTVTVLSLWLYFGEEQGKLLKCDPRECRSLRLCWAGRCPLRWWCWNLDNAWTATARLPLPSRKRRQRPLRASCHPNYTVLAVRCCGFFRNRKALGAPSPRALEQGTFQLQRDVQHQPPGSERSPSGLRGCYRCRHSSWFFKTKMGFYRSFLLCWDSRVNYRWVASSPETPCYESFLFYFYDKTAGAVWVIWIKWLKTKLNRKLIWLEPSLIAFWHCSVEVMHTSEL